MKISLRLSALLLTGIVSTYAFAQPKLPKLNAATPVGDDPRCGVVGDFNGDGKMDIATANQETNNVSILLSNGLGQMKSAPNTPIKVGAMPRALALGDFNGDQNLDLVVANSGANNLTILLGDGTGQFAPLPTPPIKVGTRPLSVAVADVDGDKKHDLVVVNNTADNISVLHGDGAGGFVEVAGSPLKVGKTPFFVMVSDVNADQMPDILVANNGSNSVSVLLGQGGGKFGPKSDFATQINPRCIAVADLNGDKNVDLAVANTGANSISLLPGDGKGNFGDATHIPVGAGPRSVVAMDLNSNGTPDLAVTCFGLNKVLVLPYETGFTPSTIGQFDVGSEPIWSVPMDMNADQKLDLVVINSDSNDVSILLGNGNNGFKR